MHRGGSYILRQLGLNPSAAEVQGFALSAAQATALSLAMDDDAQDFFYSACLSLIDALRGLQVKFYTWATVKCYYSVFYSLCALLALDDECVFYVGRTPYSIHAASGRAPAKGRGTSHQYVLDIFQKENPGHRLISQEIDIDVPPLHWLRARREDSNYRNQRFSEPDAPDHFRRIENIGVRKLLLAYLSDEDDLYTFDKDHAMLAFPVATLVHTGSALKRIGNVQFAEDELNFLVSGCCDRFGPITPLTRFFKDIAGVIA